MTATATEALPYFCPDPPLTHPDVEYVDREHLAWAAEVGLSVPDGRRTRTADFTVWRRAATPTGWC